MGHGGLLCPYRGWGNLGEGFEIPPEVMLLDAVRDLTGCTLCLPTFCCPCLSLAACHVTLHEQQQQHMNMSSAGNQDLEAMDHEQLGCTLSVNAPSFPSALKAVARPTAGAARLASAAVLCGSPPRRCGHHGSEPALGVPHHGGLLLRRPAVLGHGLPQVRFHVWTASSMRTSAAACSQQREQVFVWLHG